MKAKSYGVYEKDTGKLVEGGFFDKHAAEDAAEGWHLDTGGKEYVVKPQKEGDK
jgi:hypothetical protein